jgi:hypothetical protein
MFKVSPARHLLTRRTVFSKTLFSILTTLTWWLILFKIFLLFLCCNHQVHRDFLITLYMESPGPVSIATGLKYDVSEFESLCEHGIFSSPKVQSGCGYRGYLPRLKRPEQYIIVPCHGNPLNCRWFQDPSCAFILRTVTCAVVTSLNTEELTQIYSVLP